MCGLCIYDTFTFACKQAKLGLDSLNFATLCFVTVEMTYMEKTSIKSQTLKVNKLKAIFILYKHNKILMSY